MTAPDLPSRILAAIDETERLAQAAAKDSEPEWSPGHEHVSDNVTTAEYGSLVLCGPYGYLGWELRQHVALNDPAKTLRRCAADRRLIERHQRETQVNVCFDYDTFRDVDYCGACTVGEGCDHCISWSGPGGVTSGPVLWPCPTIRDLAEVYGITEVG